MLESFLNEVVFYIEKDSVPGYYLAHPFDFGNPELGSVAVLSDFNKVDVRLSLPEGNTLRMNNRDYKYQEGFVLDPTNLADLLGYLASLPKGNLYLVSNPKGKPMEQAAYDFLTGFSLANGLKIPMPEEFKPYSGLELRVYR